MKEFSDNNSKFDETGKKLSKRVENTMGKGEIAHYEQFLLFPQCFQKTCTADSYCSLWAISAFPAVFSKSLFCRHVKTRACLGKALKHISAKQVKCLILIIVTLSSPCFGEPISTEIASRYYAWFKISFSLRKRCSNAFSIYFFIVDSDQTAQNVPSDRWSRLSDRGYFCLKISMK